MHLIWITLFLQCDGVETKNDYQQFFLFTSGDFGVEELSAELAALKAMNAGQAHKSISIFPLDDCYQGPQNSK